MKATSDIQEGVIDDIQKIILTFEDDIEIELNQIRRYDIDLDSIECSSIELTNALINHDLLNRFKSKGESRIIKCVHIEYNTYNVNNCESNKSFLDIPCSMYIRRCRINGDVNSCGEMFVSIEGGVQ